MREMREGCFWRASEGLGLKDTREISGGLEDCRI